MEAAIDLSGLGSAIFRSYQTWGKRHAVYGKTVIAFSADINDIILAAFSEIKSDLKPGAWEVWWATNHNRFIRRKGILQRDLSKLHEVMYHFLSAFARGELEKQSDTDSKRLKAVKGKA